MKLFDEEQLQRALKSLQVSVPPTLPGHIMRAVVQIKPRRKTFRWWIPATITASCVTIAIVLAIAIRTADNQSTLNVALTNDNQAKCELSGQEGFGVEQQSPLMMSDIRDYSTNMNPTLNPGCPYGSVGLRTQKDSHYIRFFSTATEPTNTAIELRNELYKYGSPFVLTGSNSSVELITTPEQMARIIPFLSTRLGGSSLMLPPFPPPFIPPNSQVRIVIYLSR